MCLAEVIGTHCMNSNFLHISTVSSLC